MDCVFTCALQHNKFQNSSAGIVIRIQVGKLRKCSSISGSVKGLFLSRTSTPAQSSPNFLFNGNSGLLILQKAAEAWSWTHTPSSIKLKNEWSYTVTPPCALTARTGTSLSLQLLLKNGTKHFYSDAQLFTIFHSQTHWNTTISLTKAICANKCANVITIHALIPIFLSSIILQKSHHDISWLPTQVTDMYCTRPSSSCPAGNSSTSSPHKWVAADLHFSRIIYRGTRRWLRGQALELGADEPTIQLPHLSIDHWNVQILRSTIALYIFIPHESLV